MATKRHCDRCDKIVERDGVRGTNEMASASLHSRRVEMCAECNAALATWFEERGASLQNFPVVRETVAR